MTKGKRMNKNKFSIPVVIFTFKRTDTLERIFPVLKSVNVSKLYIFSDGPRNEEEKSLVENARETILKMIDWECEVVKVFSETNQGVFNSIGMGAKKVFEKEEKAIFLEDDNLPEPTFFRYCEEMLKKYQDDEKVLWVCGTNYEEKSEYLENDYVFTKHMLPCGWASWSSKFNKYYLTSFSILNDKNNRKKIKKAYESRWLYKQQIRNFRCEKYREDHNRRFQSWDFHMALTLRFFDLYGIAPKYNQIKNIGIDQFSTHGGTSKKKPNTAKFCEIPTYPLSEVLNGPKEVMINPEFEKRFTKIILVPLYIRLMFPLITLTKKILRMYPDKSFINK